MAAVAASIGMTRSRNLFTVRILALPASSWPKIRLKRQHIERGLQLTARVLIAGAPSHFNALLIERARLLHIAQFLQHLAAMKIAGRIIGIVLQQRAELGHGALHLPAV